MLSNEVKDVIKQTLPVVKANAEDITAVFYPLMFEAYPQVKAYFNEAHQLEGTQRRALANAVVAYAENLDRLEVLGDALAVIIHKHASLNILPEHYPIVGECLLKAIREVLGVGDEVINAWGAAYQQLADILIGAEEEVYRANESQSGGWRGEREFVLVKKVRESEVITSFYFEPADGAQLPLFKPGQYTAITLSIDGKEVRRNYSLSNSPGEPYFRLSVKREANGLVSNHMHDQLQAGDRVQLTQPCGEFILNEHQRPLVLLTGGVGITPAISMLQPALDSGRPVHFIHGALNSATHAFRGWVDELSDRHENLQVTYCYSEPDDGDESHLTGFFDQHILEQLLPEHRDVDLYFLGPKPFMQSINRSLKVLKLPPEQVRYEFFGPLQELESAEDVVAA
jgi:nitric oxide dioxygenase